MFYFLIFHTSISASKTIDKKILTTFLYGSVLYLILHGLIKTSKYSIFKHLADYYWYCIIIDIATLIYLTWGIIDYQGIIERFIDTSAYSGINMKVDGLDTTLEDKPLFQTKMDMNSISDYMNEIKFKGGRNVDNVGKQVNINETANEVCNFETMEAPNTITQPQSKVNTVVRESVKVTTARDMGLEQSTSLEELGIGNVEDVVLSGEPVERGISLPEGAKDFFADTIDVSDHVSNISDIEDIDLDDFANNLK